MHTDYRRLWRHSPKPSQPWSPCTSFGVPAVDDDLESGRHRAPIG
jgi:hypothetical protein